MEEKIKEKKCELCKEKATNICFDCSFYLCDSCFSFLHEKKANLNHKKEIIDPFVSIDIRCPDHPNNKITIFCIEEKSKYYFLMLLKKIELFCPSCCLLNKHDKDHNIININNKDSFKKYDISYDKSIYEFDKLFKMAKNTKQRIEEEKEELNLSHKKIINEITSSFEEQRLKLNRKEKQLKLELDEKVKTIKEELDKLLIESNNIIIILRKNK